MANIDLDSALNLLSQYLTEHKLRNTEERRKILAYIINIDGHFTAKTLHAELNEQFSVSLATIYNTLDLFVKLKFIVSHHFFDDKIEYELFSNSLNHHHRICTICGEVKEFSDLKMKRTINSKKFSSFQTEYASLYIYGICKKCQRKKHIKIK